MNLRYLLLITLALESLGVLRSGSISGFDKPPQPQVSPTEQYTLRFSPRPQQTLVYSLQSRMETEGQSFLGKSLTLSAQADGEIDVFIRQVATDGSSIE